MQQHSEGLMQVIGRGVVELFSWTMQTRGLRVIGSCERASECVKRKYKLIIDCDEIFIENREVC